MGGRGRGGPSGDVAVKASGKPKQARAKGARLRGRPAAAPLKLKFIKKGKETARDPELSEEAEGGERTASKGEGEVLPASWYYSVWEPKRFEAELPKPGDLLEFVVVDEDVERRGSVVARVAAVGKCDSEGVHVSVNFVGTDAPDLEQWAANSLKADMLKMHLCRGSCHLCPLTASREALHVDCWRVRCLRDIDEAWIIKGLGPDIVGVEKYQQAERASQGDLRGKARGPPVFGKEVDRGISGAVGALGERLAGSGAAEETRGGTWLGLPARGHPPGEGVRPRGEEVRRGDMRGEESGGARPSGLGATPALGRGAPGASPDGIEQLSREELVKRVREAAKSQHDAGDDGGRGERKKIHKEEQRFGRLVLDRGAKRGRERHRDDGSTTSSSGRDRTQGRSRRRRRRRRGGSRSASSSGSREPRLSRLGPIQQVAASQPGELLRNGLSAMSRHVTGHETDASGETSAKAVARPELAANYLVQALLPSGGHNLSLHAERELRTLAEVCDAIVAGNPLRAGDVAMQRFRAVEYASSQEGGWQVARHLELIPTAGVSSVPIGLRTIIAREQATQERARVAQKGKGESKGSSKGSNKGGE